MSNNGALNARQERFAQLLAEGMPQSRAYIEAGYKARGNAAYAEASRLVRKDKVMARLDALRVDHAEAANVTVQSVTQMLIAAYELSISERQGGAATQAAMGLAKLHGFLVDRQQVEAVIYKPSRSPTDRTDMTLEEWIETFGPKAAISSSPIKSRSTGW
jgi:phage terminase small subunit